MKKKMQHICLRLLEGLESKMDSFKFNTLLLATASAFAWGASNGTWYLIGDDVFHNVELTQGREAAMERAKICYEKMDNPIFRVTNYGLIKAAEDYIHKLE